MNPLTQRDQKTIWHPFTQHGLEEELLAIKSAKGAWLTLDDNHKILDAISSWWVNIHGHAHPTIIQAIYKQANQLDHVMFGGFTHEPGVQLAELLTTAACERGTDLTRCFYTDNGATAVEAAMKMAYQYHKNKGVHTRTKFISLTHAYHGDTLGAMAVSARGSYHTHFSELLPPVDFFDTDDIASLEKCLREHPEQYAACIVEPIVQAASGMKMYPPHFLTTLAKACQRAGVLLICDEVFTGFYRTGKLFAFEHADIKPDFICLSKGLTGGVLPLAAVLTTEEIFNVFKSTDMHKGFWHGHTFTANPLACAAAIASWELLKNIKTQQAIDEISTFTQSNIQKLATHKNCLTARALGTIGVVELKNTSSYFSNVGYKIRQYAIKQGVLLRPLGSTLYALPPYCVTHAELEKIYHVMLLILNETFI